MKRNRRLICIYIAVLSLLAGICTALLVGGANKNSANEKQHKIGVIYMTLNNPYFDVINKEISIVVQEKGDKLITRDAELDQDQQNRQIENLIDMGVDIIILNVVDYEKALPGLEKAREAGIPVLAIDARVRDEEYVVGTIYSNNYGAGCLIAQDLMKKSSGGNLLLLEHKSNQSSRERINGFLDTLDENKWPYKIVDELETYGQLEIAEPLVEKLLDEGKQIDVVMGLNDPAALGAMAALDSKGMLSDVFVYGVDGAPAAKSMIYKGLMEATVAQSPRKTGRLAIDYAYKVLSGEKIDKYTMIDVNFISLENIGQYSLTNWN